MTHMPQEPLNHSPLVSPSVAAAIQGLTPTELARLVAYRAAVRAGFYTDWPHQHRAVTEAESIGG